MYTDRTKQNILSFEWLHLSVVMGVKHDLSYYFNSWYNVVNFRPTHPVRPLRSARLYPQTSTSTGSPFQPPRGTFTPHSTHQETENTLDVRCDNLRCGQWTNTWSNDTTNSALAYRELCTVFSDCEYSIIKKKLFTACWEKMLPLRPWCSVSKPRFSLVSFRTPCSWDILRGRSIATRDTRSDEYWSANEISTESQQQNHCFWNTSPQQKPDVPQTSTPW